MAARVLSPRSYMIYLNDYIVNLLEKSDRSLLILLHESYLDEIEQYAARILGRWLNDENIEQENYFYLANVGLLNARLIALAEIFRLDRNQLERLQSLLCPLQTIHHVENILQLLLEATQWHNDVFFRYLAIFLDPWSLLMEKENLKNLSQLCQEILRSKIYRQYLHDLSSSAKVEAKHRFFIGTVSRLTAVHDDPAYHRLYTKYLLQIYHQPSITTDNDFHNCTRGILHQLHSTTYVNDSSRLSLLLSIFYFATNEKRSLVLPLFHLFNDLCRQSNTVAARLNGTRLIETLLQYVLPCEGDSWDIHSCLLLGHVISDEQLIHYQIQYKLTMKLIDLFVDDRYNRQSILLSLRSLVLHPSIQMVCVQTFQLPTFISWANDYPLAYEILWILSFHPMIVDQLTNRHQTFLRQLVKVSKIPATLGIISNVHTVVNPPPSSDIEVVLIYSPKDRVKIEQLRQQLLNNNVQFGSYENASCLLFCMSEESKHDCHCQQAIRQALIDGRRILFATIDKPCRLDDWFKQLPMHERNFFNLVEFDLEKILVYLPQIRHEPLPPIVKPLNVQKWNNEDVLRWCKAQNLTIFTKLLQFCDGRRLTALAKRSETSIEPLKVECRQIGLTVSVDDCRRFQSALRPFLPTTDNRLKKSTANSLASQYLYRDKEKYLK